MPDRLAALAAVTFATTALAYQVTGEVDSVSPTTIVVTTTAANPRASASITIPR